MKRSIRSFWRRNHRLILALTFSHAVSVLLFLARSFDSGNQRYWFLLWNAFLGLLPLGFAICLRSRLRFSRWLSWQNLALSLLWLAFLPNSFYLVSDLIHLHQTGEVSIVYDAAMFTSFIINGMIVGLISVFLMHAEMLKRIRMRHAHLIIGIVFLACGFAIYLGRYMRWNSWDILVNPAGVLFDVSSQFITPASPGMLATTFSFFLLLGSTYVVACAIVGSVKK